MKTTFRVILALLLTLTLCFCVMPLAFAEGESNRSGEYTTITFYSNAYNASGYMDSMQVTDEAKPLTKNTFTRQGYQFIDWNTDPSGYGTAFADEEIVDTSVIITDVTLYAQWSKIFKIQYMSNGGSGIMTNQMALSGIELEIRDNGFTKTGADFDSWNTRADGSGTTYKASDKHTFKETDSDLTLYAQWTYPVTFDPNGGYGELISGNMDKALEKQDYFIPDGGDIQRPGYAFNGWNTKADGTGDWYADGGIIPASKVTGPITLYAQWDQEYTVSFKNTADSSQTMEPQIILKSELDKEGISGIALNPNTFTYDGYVFTGWSKNAAGTDGHFDDEGKVKAADFDSYASLVLYAQWDQELTITFKPGYDTPLTHTQSVAKGKTVEELDANTFKRAQYLFKEWKTDDGITYPDKASIPAQCVTEDFTLTAQWVGPLTIEDTMVGSDSVAYVGDTIQANIAGLEDDTEITYHWYAMQMPTSTSRMKLTVMGKTIVRSTIPKAGNASEFPYIYCVASKGSEEDGTYQEAQSNYILLKDKLDTVYWGMDFINDGNLDMYPNSQYYTTTGYIIGVEEGMEYSTDGGATWTKIPSNRISDGNFLVPGVGTYIIRQGGVISDPITIYNWYVVGYTVSTSTNASGTVRITASNSSSSSGAMPATPVLANSTQRQRDDYTIMKLASNVDNMWAVRSDNSRSINLVVQSSASSYAHVSLNGENWDSFGGIMYSSSSSSSSSSKTFSVSPINEPKLYTIVFNGLPDSITDDIVVEIDETAFPDPIFRSILLEQRYDRNRDGKLSESEIYAIKTMSFYNEGISSLRGIEYFTELTTLYCSDNNLTELDLSACKSLTNLNCQGNYLTQLDLRNCPELRKLICSDNTLKALDVSGCPALASLDCSANVLAQLALDFNASLTSLNCSNNNLTNLDLSGNSALNSLICYGNALRQVTLAENAALVVLNCSGNLLSNLAIGDNSALRNLRCSGNLLTDLDLSGAPVLNNLECQGNRLNSLSVTDCDALSTVNCANNLLEQLNVSGCTVLKTLHCEQNQLTTLDLNDCDSLKTLFCYDNSISNLDLIDCPILVELVESREPVITGTWVTYGEMNEVYGGPVLRCDNIVELNTRSSIEDLTPDLILPSSLTVIEAEAFSGGAFSYVVLPDGAESIGSRAFADCPKLAYIYIPASVTSIDENAFDGVEDLTIFGAPGSAADEYASLHGFTFAAQQ